MENYLSKASSNGTPLVSIVTVVFNAGRTIEETIQSVLTQSYKNIEYIIIDGKSNDSTVDVIKKHESSIKYWISEIDSGVYDAMNKGIDQSKGDWLIFLGADDKLFDELVIEKLIIATQLDQKGQENPLVIFGNTLYSSGKYFRSFVNVRTLIRNTIQHQSAIYHKSLFNNFRYDSSLRINSDYELNLILYLKNIQVKYINSTIAVCSCGGLSTDFNNARQAVEEFSKIRIKYISALPNKIINFLLNTRLSIKILMRRFIFPNRT